MTREDRFLISHRPYAVDLGSLRAAATPSGNYYAWVRAVWFRRRDGVTAACVGTLWDLQAQRPEDAQKFLERHDDGRYGGSCKARLDATGYWADGSMKPGVIEADLALLRPMLENFPAIPDGYDGWWRF